MQKSSVGSKIVQGAGLAPILPPWFYHGKIIRLFPPCKNDDATNTLIPININVIAFPKLKPNTYCRAL